MAAESALVNRNRGRNSHRPRGHVAPAGRAGFDIVPHRPSGKTRPPAQCRTWLPRVKHSFSCVPAQ